jgi:hypothetical protein
MIEYNSLDSLLHYQRDLLQEKIDFLMGEICQWNTDFLYYPIVSRINLCVFVGGNQDRYEHICKDVKDISQSLEEDVVNLYDMLQKMEKKVKALQSYDTELESGDFIFNPK